MRALLIALLSVNAVFAVSRNVWEPPFFNGVAAQVEKDLITYDDIRRQMAPISPQLRANAKTQEEYDAQMESLYKTTRDTLIERALLVSEFETKGYKMPAKDVDIEYRRILKEDFNNSTSALVESLQGQGLTLPVYRSNLRENMMIQALQSRFRHDLPQITPEQIASFYKENQNKFAQSGSVNLSVITFAPITDEPLDVILQTAKEVREKAIGGEDFNKLAQDFNQEGSPEWGWIDLADLAAEVKETLTDVKVGQLAEPITLEDSKVLLIRLNERRDEGVASLESVRPQIERTLFEAQAQAAYTKWMDQLKKKYFVKINE